MFDATANTSRSDPVAPRLPGVGCDLTSSWGRRSVLSWAAVAGGMLLLVAATLIGELAGSTPVAGWLLAVDVVVGVAGSLALPVVTPWRLRAVAVLITVSAVSPTATPLAATATLWVAARRPLRVAVAVAASGVAAMLLRGLWRPQTGLGFGWWTVVSVAGYAALVGWGAWAQARRALVASLRERARRAEDEQAARVADARRAERTRIAREMHDVLAHRLTLLTAYAGALEYRDDLAPAQVTEAAGVIRSSARAALEELRDVIGVLRDDEAGAVGTRARRPVPGFEALAGLIDESRRAGATVTVEDRSAHDGASLPPAVGRTVHRVVQEALTNAHKHAPGQPIGVQLAGAPGGTFEIEVVNNLPQGPPADPLPGSGTGLAGLAERVHLAGGSFDHGPTGDGRYRVHVSLPWPA